MGFFTASKKKIGLSCVLSLNISLNYHKFCYGYDLLVRELRVVNLHTGEMEITRMITDRIGRHHVH